MNADVVYQVFVRNVGWVERHEVNVSLDRVARLRRSRLVAIENVSYLNDLWEPRENIPTRFALAREQFAEIESRRRVRRGF